MFPELSSLAYFRVVTSLILLLLICLPGSEASSSPLGPLKHVEAPSISLQRYPRSPQSISIDNPQTLTYFDPFRLTVSAYGETYHLHLKPNDQLLHPSARINHYRTNDNGEIILDRTEPLVMSQIKAYLGDVIHSDHTDDRLQEDLVGGLVNSKYHPLGWARIMVYDEGNPELSVSPRLEGAFSVNGIPHHIMTREKYMRLKNPQDPIPGAQDGSLVIFRDSDITPTEGKQISLSALKGLDDLGYTALERDSHFCNHDHLEWNRNPSLNPVLRQPKQPTWLDVLVYGDSWAQVNPNTSVWRRDDIAGNNMDSNFESHIGQTAGCPVDPSVIFMGVAADCSYVQQHGSPENATMAILNNWNMASSLYKQTFNINLAIIEINVHDSACPTIPDPAFPWNEACSADITLNDRLSLFSQWRGTRQNDSAGLWHLMSGCPTGTEIGVAWLGTLCQTTTTGTLGQFVSGTAVTTAGRSEWQVISHEIGHNFGAIHDCVSGCNSSTPCCPFSTAECDSNSQFIMSPTSQSNEVTFSRCTIGNICSLMQSKTNNTTCLLPPNSEIRTISLQMCGNGIVEGDEECDSGFGVQSRCCNSMCKFNTGAVCDPSNGACCTTECEFSPSTQVCRSALDSRCDFPEMCSGNSSSCPWDRTQPNGLSCGPNGQACASGQCTSLALQCQTVGASLGLESACPAKGDTSCQVSCQTPDVPSQCTKLQAQLIDGSPCGFGGSCSNGRCASGGVIATVKSWYRQNLQIAIPITVIAAVLFLFVLYTLIRCLLRRDCCCRKYPKKVISEPAFTSVSPLRLHSWTGTSSSSQQKQRQRESAHFANTQDDVPVSASALHQERLRQQQQTPPPVFRPQQQLNVIQTVTYSDGRSIRSSSHDDHSVIVSSPTRNNPATGGPPTSYRRPSILSNRSESLYPSWVEAARRQSDESQLQHRY